MVPIFYTDRQVGCSIIKKYLIYNGNTGRLKIKKMTITIIIIIILKFSCRRQLTMSLTKKDMLNIQDDHLNKAHLCDRLKIPPRLIPIEATVIIQI